MLRAVTLEDAAALFEYARDPAMTQYVSWETHQALADSEAFLRRLMQAYQTVGIAVWAITLPADGRMIGTVGLHGDYDSPHK